LSNLGKKCYKLTEYGEVPNLVIEVEQSIECVCLYKCPDNI